MVPVWVLNCNYPCTDRAIVLHWCAFCYLQNYSCVYPAAAARLLLCLFHMLWLRLPPSAPLPFIRSLSSAFFILSVYSTPPSPPFDQVYSITQYFPPFHEMLLHLPTPSYAFFYIHNSSSPSLLPLSRPPITSAFFSPPLFSLSMISPPSLLFPLHLVVNLNFLLLISCYYFIFVTGTTGGTRGEKIFDVEKLQNSIHDRCEEISNFSTESYFQSCTSLRRARFLIKETKPRRQELHVCTTYCSLIIWKISGPEQTSWLECHGAACALCHLPHHHLNHLNL